MLTDDELVRGFEEGSLDDFPHRSHVRVGLIYLSRYGHSDALRRLLEGLRRFAAAKGHPEKFHVTMTHAWLDLIEAARRAHPGLTPASLLDVCPELLDRDALSRFYTPGRLHSEDARTGWVPPDLAEIGRI
jgi:hypothetical protein